MEPIPPEEWSVAKKHTDRPFVCPCCDRAPETLDPLPPGWCWDTMEPSNPWVWCPKWTADSDTPNASEHTTPRNEV